MELDGGHYLCAVNIRTHAVWIRETSAKLAIVILHHSLYSQPSLIQKKKTTKNKQKIRL